MGSKAKDGAADQANQYQNDWSSHGGAAAQASYQQAMNGQDPSFAQQLLHKQTQDNIANQHALAMSGRGRDPAAANRQMMMGTANMNQQAAGQGAMLRTQEIEQARAGLAGLASGFAGGSTQASQVGAGIGSADDPWNKIVQGAGAVGQGIAGGIKAFSDETLKTDIEDGAAPVRNFLDHITAKKYKYKPGAAEMPEAGKGTYVSPMAQDLEKSELGKSMVKDTPAGKLVDYGKGFGAMLAAQADIHSRLKKIEKGAE